MRSQGNASVWVVIALLVAAAILLFVFSGDQPEASDTATTTQETEQSTSTDEDMAAIQAALNGDGAVECTYDVSSRTANSYIKNGEIRTIAETEVGTTNMIFSEGQIHIWEEGSTQGVVFSADAVPDGANQTPIPIRPNDIAESAGSENISCQVSEEVADSLFVIPEDVTFADSFSGGATSSNTSGLPQ